MKKLKLILFNLILLLMVNPVSANQYIESPDNLVSFSVRAVLPENQISEASFFEIEMEPGAEQELEVIIDNTSEEDIEVAIGTQSAATNSNGVIIYDGSLQEFDKAMKYSFGDIAEAVEPTVTIPALEERLVRIRVVAPAESFDGQILGGIQFSLADEEEADSKDVSIQQRFSYVVGVNIVEKGNQTEVEPQVELEEVSVEAVNGQTALQTIFANKKPVLIRNLTVKGEIVPVDEPDQTIYQREVERFSIAPYSIFNFPIVFEDGNLIAGEYIFKATAKNSEVEWEFERTFVVE